MKIEKNEVYSIVCLKFNKSNRTRQCLIFGIVLLNAVLIVVSERILPASNENAIIFYLLYKISIELLQLQQIKYLSRMKSNSLLFSRNATKCNIFYYLLLLFSKSIMTSNCVFFSNKNDIFLLHFV